MYIWEGQAGYRRRGRLHLVKHGEGGSILFSEMARYTAF